MQEAAELNSESTNGGGGSRKYIYGVAAVVLIATLVLGYFLYRVSQGKKSSSSPAQVVQEDASEKGEIGYQEPTTTVQIGSEKVSGGSFSKVEDGKIFYEKDGVATSLPMTEDEVVLSCTNQDLNNAVELDYDQVTSVYVMTPAELGVRIPAGESIVVFADYVEEVLRAHTVAMAASSCDQ
jgi:hypothetical protein